MRIVNFKGFGLGVRLLVVDLSSLLFKFVVLFGVFFADFRCFCIWLFGVVGFELNLIGFRGNCLFLFGLGVLCFGLLGCLLRFLTDRLGRSRFYR